MSELSLIKKTESVEYDLLPVEFKVSGSEIISKLGEYIPLIKKLAEEQMSVVLETDEDFAKKEEFNKKVKEARENLKQQATRIEKHFESLAKFNTDLKQ